MLSDVVEGNRWQVAHFVLILVLMEYALWRWKATHFLVGGCLNPCSNGICSLTFDCIANKVAIYVLILVLMEYALWQRQLLRHRQRRQGLNPCSNGICSLTVSRSSLPVVFLYRLNPCSNGICSLTTDYSAKRGQWTRLNPCSNGICSLTHQ